MTDRHEAALRAALAERDRLVYPANEAVADWVIESIVEAALAAADAHDGATSQCGPRCSPPIHVGHGLGVDTDDPRVHLTGEPDQYDGAVLCSDGSRVHDFQGERHCPGCGWGGIFAVGEADQ